MTIVRWDPIHRLFEGFPARPTAAGWRPAVDVFETDDDLVFRVELPGVERDAIGVLVENGVLTVSGERKRDERVTTASAHHIERGYGRFERSFRLPEGWDGTATKAVYKHGVLELSIPRSAEARSRTIAVEAA